LDEVEAQNSDFLVEIAKKNEAQEKMLKAIASLELEF
jgi:hypothetical protein